MFQEMAKPNRKLSLISIYLLVAVLSGVTALVLLLGDPSEAGNIWILGLSKTRLVVALGLLFWISGFTFLLGQIWFNSRRSDWLVNKFRAVLERNFVYGLLLVFSVATLLITSQLWRLSLVVEDSYVQGYLNRLIPLLFLALAFSLQNLLFLPLIRYGFPKVADNFPRSFHWVSVGIFVILCVLWILFAITGLGIQPDKIGWDAPGVPLLASQVWLVWAIGALFLGFELLISKRDLRSSISFRLDIIVSIFLWGIAVLLWSQQPLSADYFAPEPRPPNFEIYPHSDAATHDVMAQRLLVGEGFPGVARKPLYVILLSLFHMLGGQSYQRVVFFQILLIAVLPVLIYWLTRLIHCRTSGLIAAFLIILRERNALGLSGVIGVSHTKLLMSDLPATLGIVLLTLVIVAWLRKPNQHRLYPLTIGGILGLLLLLRPQITVLVPAILVFTLLMFLRRLRLGLLNIGFIILGLGLTLFPWLWRSYQLTGQFVLNDPAQNAFLTQQYTLNPGHERMKPLPGETEGEFSQRVDAYLRDFIRNNPVYFANFVTSHFAHNLVEMVVTLPMSPWVVQNAESDLFPHWRQQSDRLWQACCSVPAYVRSQPFWDQWLGELSVENVLSLLINLGLLAIGLSVAFTHQRFIGWVPLGVSLVYVLSTSLGRYSGWRLILPADWVLFMYFSMGLGWFSHQILFYIIRQDVYTAKSEENRKKQPEIEKIGFHSAILPGLLFLGLGLVPNMIERFVHTRYDDATIPKVIQTVEIQEEIDSFLDDERAQIILGRALYPRFYGVDKGEPGGDWPAFSPREYPRLGFVLVGPTQTNVVLPLDQAPAYFPHASDVIVFVCPADGFMLAKQVVLIEEDEYTLVPSSEMEISCDA